MTAPTSAPLTRTATFTPSELVLLHGDRFAAKAGMLTAKERLLRSDLEVATRDLGFAAIAVALLANEHAGVVRFEQRTKKALFGLVKNDNVVMAPTGARAEWHEGSLEAAVQGAVRGGEVDVGDWLAEYLGSDSADPWGVLLYRAKVAMASRGLLALEDRKALKLITYRAYGVVGDTDRLAAEESPDAVQRLLDRAERERPDLWKALTKEIEGAVSKRTEHEDVDSGD
jgi:hypothetical protein